MLQELRRFGSASALTERLEDATLESYAKVIERRQGGGGANRGDAALPTADEQEAMMSNYNEDMFTEDAWLGMKRYVDTIADREDEAGCEACRDNRLILEKAWQVVANEFYDPRGRFSQAAWADELQPALARHGGVLRTKRELYAAAQEMVAQLRDPYSEFMPPAQFRAAIRKPSKAERDYAAAQAIGVGLKVGGVANGSGRAVVATLSGSTAEAAGIGIGDTLMSVDGVAAASLAPEAVERLFRGPVSSTVDVVVKHPSKMGTVKGTEELTLERLPIPQPAAVRDIVQYDSDPSRIAQYIRINYFSSDSTKSVMQAIIEGETLGVDGYIIDLRNNPGGVFEEAIASSSYFLEADGSNTHIVETVRNTDAVTHRDVIDNVWTVGILPTEVFPRTAWGLTSRPVVLLVNGGTASASEVMAAALQDNQRAILIGDRTFGKGVVQYYFTMADGSGLKLTVAKYLTPDYHDISLEGGIQPDMMCSDHPRGLLPGASPDTCVVQALRYVVSHPLGGSSTLLGHTASR